MDSQWHALDAHSTTSPGRIAGSGQAAYVIYTSGSTGRPKGVSVPHRCVLRLALDDAHVSAGEVDYVNAHGSSTPLNDPTETIAIKTTLGDRASRIPVSGTKGYYGPALGASGAIEAAICALALEREWLPPTVNLREPDATCDLDYVPGDGRTERVEHLISNSFGFGGINAALVFRKADV
jgi:3-oxoacyl-[acyl-carrier-protein] synthase II